MDFRIDPSWRTLLLPEFEKPYFEKLTMDVHDAYARAVVFPPMNDIFNAFNLCSFSTIRVVILGQDPYHGANQAHGLSFSVVDGIKLPPSLKNIYKEIAADIGTPMPATGNLSHWAKQGVLLLNATLTVAEGQPGSHQKLGWETFTDAVIQKISAEKSGVVFLLWGRFAQAKKVLIDTNKHLVLEAPHPSPFSAHSGFFGCKHFSQTNSYLSQNGSAPIAW
jgi:uracil-DNA glycosylase